MSGDTDDMNGKDGARRDGAQPDGAGRDGANGVKRARLAGLARLDPRRIGLSGRLLMLTIVFVMLAEVLIYVPSIANFRLTWLDDRLDSAKIAALVLDAAEDRAVPRMLERSLLTNAGLEAVAVKRGGTRRLLTLSDMPHEVDAHFDIRDTPATTAIADAFGALFAPDGRLLRVVGEPQMAMAREAGVAPDADETDGSIEIVIDETPLRAAMIRYSANILTLSIIISVVTAALVYFSLNWLLVRPMRRITGSMVNYRADPEDSGRVITLSGRSDEIGLAERELAAMQTQLGEALHQKARLAALGLAVSKINHDLRNILASAQLISDRLAGIADPTVQRLAPKLVASLDRAIALCAHTIKYGKAREAPPERQMVALRILGEQVAEAAGVSAHETIRWVNAVPDGLMVDADPDQLFRVLMNLMRNAAQALESSDAQAGEPVARLAARREGAVVTIQVSDTGPGVPQRARDHLFEAFQGAARPGGSGLGLAIAAELVRAHGGSIRLVDGTLGATFQVVIPDRVVEIAGRRATPA